jgi:hypothetical protein
MAQIFENTRIIMFQPKQEKDKETQEVLDKLIFKGETKLDNSLQITELFAGFRKKLIPIKFIPYGDFETELFFNDVSIEDFTVKNKIEKIGSGKDTERIPVETVQFKMAVKMDENGDFLKQMYSIFNYTVKMEIG